MPKNYPARLFNYNALPPTDGLMAAWNLSNTTDSSGNGNTLTNNNAVTFTAGKIGNAATFNGVNQALSIADNAFLSGGGQDALSAGLPFGVVGWFKINALPGAGNIFGLFSKWDSGANQCEYYGAVTDTGILRFEISNNGIDSLAVDSPINTIQPNVWYFFCAWYDSYQLNLEINNNNVIYENELTITTNPQGIFNGTADFVIGAFNTPRASFLNGQVDALRIYKHPTRIFNKNECSALFNNGIGREFVVSNVVSSFEVNRELNLLVNTFNGINTDITPVISPVTLTDPALVINQNGLGPIAQFIDDNLFDPPFVTAEIKNNGQYMSYALNPSPPFTSSTAFDTSLVENLNVDLLGGKHAADILQLTSILPICNSEAFINTIPGLGERITLVVSGNQLLSLFIHQNGVASADYVTIIRASFDNTAATVIADLQITGNSNAVVVADITDVDLSILINSQASALTALGVYRINFDIISSSGTNAHRQITVGAVTRQLPI